MLKQVIVMRTDLNMRKGKMIAQGAHASVDIIISRLLFDKHGYSSSDKQDVTWPEITKWVFSGMAKICVGVDSEEKLVDIYDDAHDAGLPCSLIIDEGRTEFAGKHTKTCVAIGPAEAELIDEITGNLKLL